VVDMSGPSELFVISVAVGGEFVLVSCALA
jgi:hypothetical protein